MSDLSTVKVGDEIVVNVAQYGPDRFQIRRVTRATKTQITDAIGGRWRVSDGRGVGDTDRLTSRCAFVPEPERMARIREGIEASTLRESIKAALQTAPLQALRKADAALQEVTT